MGLVLGVADFECVRDADQTSPSSQSRDEPDASFATFSTSPSLGASQHTSFRRSNTTPRPALLNGMYARTELPLRSHDGQLRFLHGCDLCGMEDLGFEILRAPEMGTDQSSHISENA